MLRGLAPRDPVGRPRETTGECIRMRSKLATALCLAAGFSLCASAAWAQSDDRFANGVDVKERRACTPDVQRLCNDYVPDVTQIVACLKRELDQGNLHAPCAQAVAAADVPAPKPAKKPPAKKPKKASTR
jgi:hypothetical protein